MMKLVTTREALRRQAMGVLLIASIFLYLGFWTTPVPALAEESDGFQEVVILEGEPSASLQSASQVTSQQAYARIVALKGTYPEGMRWTNDDFYSSPALHQAGYGCHAFALICSDAAFGDNPGTKYYDVTQARVGDILRINDDTHTVVVLEVRSDGVVVAEGNYNSSIHWGRSLKFSDLRSGFSYGITRYLDGSAEPDHEPGTYGIGCVQPSHASIRVAASSAKPWEDVSVTANVDSGYVITSLNVTDEDGKAVSVYAISETEWTFPMPESAVEVSATVVPLFQAHRVVVEGIAHGGHVETSHRYALSGDSVEVSVVADEKFNALAPTVTDASGNEVEFDAISLSPNGRSRGGIFTMPDSDVTVSGSVEEALFDVIVEQPEHGTIKVNRTTAHEGDLITVTLEPDPGYAFVSVGWESDGNSGDVIAVESDGKISEITVDPLEMTYSDMRIYGATTRLEGIEHEIILESGEGVSADLPATAMEDERVTFTVSLEDGYELLCDPEVRAASGGIYQVYSEGNGRFSFFMGEGDMVVTLRTRATEPDEEVPFFPDVPEGQWYTDAVAWAAENGIMNGYDSGLFGPDDRLTRDQFAQVIWNRAGRPWADKGYVDQFSDCSVLAYYAEAVTWCYQSGYMTGFNEVTFGTGHNITREQAATVLWRMAGSPSAETDLTGYADEDSISTFAREAMEWAVSEGVLQGQDNGVLLDPTGVLTRAQAAMIFMRLDA